MDNDTTVAGKNQSPFTLLDLVSADELQQVQDSFASATGVASIIIDADGRSLTRPSNFSPVCDMVVESAEGRRLCELSNRRRDSQRNHEGRPVYHECLACGFVDASAPIIVDGKHIADWLIGQCDVFRVGETRIREFAARIGIDPDRMAEAYRHVQSIPRERFEHLLDLLWHVAGGLSELGFRNLQYRRELGERRQIEQRLLQQNREHSALLDAMPDLVFRISREGIFVDCHGNSEDLYLRPDQFIGQSVSDILPPELADQTMCYLHEAFAAGTIQVYEYTLTLAGVVREFEARMTVCSPDMVVVVVRDITERKLALAEKDRLRERLEKAERMQSLGVLAGGVAHDLNNLLGPLVGYPELILSKLPADSPVARFVESMRKAAVDASGVIQDLLTLSRRERYDMRPVDLNEVVLSSLNSAQCRNLASRKPGVVLTSNLCESVASMNGSFSHLQKMVFNLVSHAYGMVGAEGRIEVTTSRRRCDTLQSGYNRIEPGEYVVLSVRDNGHGISVGDVERIFEPYYSKAVAGLEGSGLGLPVVYGVVKDHGGYYDVFSEPEKGSEFVLYFQAIASPVAAHPEIDDFNGHGERILVVDDVSAQRELAAELLGGLNYAVTVATNGHDALHKLADHPVDLVVLDMIMEEGFDGLDTYRELLKISPGLKAVIVSGFSSTERVQEMQRLGAGAYIRKPYAFEALGRAIRMELTNASAVDAGPVCQPTA